MKQIKLKHITPPVKRPVGSIGKFYSVPLGNNYTGLFTSNKQARAFLSETNRQLNIKLFELNFLYSDLLRLYRGSWLYFDRNKAGANNLEFLCTAKFTAIENSFNLLVDRSAWPNGNYLTFSHFKAIIIEIKSICELLKPVFKKRGITSVIYELEALALRSDYILTAVFIYPQQIKLLKDKLQPSVSNILKVV